MGLDTLFQLPTRRNNTGSGPHREVHCCLAARSCLSKLLKPTGQQAADAWLARVCCSKPLVAGREERCLAHDAAAQHGRGRRRRRLLLS